MKKAVKKSLPIAVSVLCLVAILFSVCWFVPSLKFEVFGIPTRSDPIFPQPYQIKGYAWGQEVALNEDQQKTVYALLSYLEGQACRYAESLYEKTIPNDVLSCKNNEYCLELFYPYMHRQTELALWGESVASYEYDRLFLVIGANAIRMSPFTDGHYTGVNGQWVEFVLEEGLYDFRESVKDTLAEDILSPLKIKRGRVDPSVMEVDSLWACPDDMVVAHNGQVLLLSVEERDRIYDAFAQMDEMQAGLPRYGETIKECYTNEALYKDVTENPCLELRFYQRRRIAGAFAQQEEALSGGEAAAYFDTPFEYDAILLIMGETGMKVVICRDGAYTGLYNGHWWLDFGPGYADFRAEVLSLIV